ncbi:MAG: DNA (cytosine-5-)-methyltransferase [Sulfuritalea sp.]|nr:DNA (cytosine-5-)-methyltransferase [Sulfuritalea sp.]
MSRLIPRESAMLAESAETVYFLEQAVARYNVGRVAEMLGKAPKTITRWRTGKTPPPSYLAPALQKILDFGRVTPSGGDFTFIDLFAGIGGIRLGFQSHGGRCVFTSEWNTWSQKTYVENFRDAHEIVGDIVPCEAKDIPDHDVLLAGFPCQPFSIAGVSKKNALGRPHGFECTTQGTLFFDVARIIAEKRPKAFLLESNKRLVSHDKGNTFRVILHALREELGYDVHYRVIDARHFVPQHRERILIVGFREPTGFSWDALQFPESGPVLSSILHPENGSELPQPPYTHGAKATVHDKYVLTDKLWAYLQAYAEKHRAAGNGFGFGLVTPEQTARTLSARYYKDGSEILVSRGKNKNPRRLTPRECARLMGFPDDFRIPVSDTQAYRQFGDASVPSLIDGVARAMKPHVMIAISTSPRMNAHGN